MRLIEISIKKSRCTLVSNLNTEHDISVKKLCDFVDMTRQNFYAYKRERTKQNLDEDLIVSLVLDERKLQPRLGGRKLFYLLEDEFIKHGIEIGRDRFFDILRVHNLLVKKRKRVAKTTDSYHCLPVFNNIIDDLEVTAPHQVLVSDLTYIKVGNSFVYASLITDRYSRKIVGAYLGDTLESIGCQKALKQALKQLPSGANVIHHSDRGCQYCCHDYIEMLNSCHVKVSMTEKYHCYENSVAERVNGILKDEYSLAVCFKTKEQALKSFNQAIMLYNNRRPHLGLNYATPEEVHNGKKEGCIIPPLGLLKKAA